MKTNDDLEPAQDNFDWAKWEEIMNRDKRRPGEPEMSPQEEEEWIAEQVRAMRVEERAGRIA